MQVVDTFKQNKALNKSNLAQKTLNGSKNAIVRQIPQSNVMNDIKTVSSKTKRQSSKELNQLLNMAPDIAKGISSFKYGQTLSKIF